MTSVITTSDDVDITSLSTDLVATVLGDCHGEFSQIISQFIDRGFDVLANKIPPSTKRDYSIKAIVQNITTWRCCQIANNKNNTNNNTTSESNNTNNNTISVEDRIHFMQFKPPKKSSHVPVRRLLFLADAILIPVAANIADVYQLEDSTRMALKLLCSSYLEESASALGHKRHIVIVFCTGYDDDAKAQFAEKMSQLLKGWGGSQRMSVSYTSVGEKQVFEELRSILTQNKNDNNNNNNNITNNFFTAAAFGVCEIPSIRNSNKKFAIVRSDSTRFIENGKTIISFSASNMGATFLVDDHVPMFGRVTNDGVSSAASSSTLLHVLVLSELHNVINPSTGVATPFFIPTLFDPANNQNPKFRESDGHGNAYMLRTTLTPFIFFDISKQQASLRPARFLFVEVNDSAISSTMTVGRPVKLFGLGGECTGFVVDVDPPVKKEWQNSQDKTTNPEKVRCVIACFTHSLDTEQLLFPSEMNETGQEADHNWFVFVGVATGSSADNFSVNVCQVRHVVRQGDFAMELLNCTSSSSSSSSSTINNNIDKISTLTFFQFLESVLFMTPRTCSSREDVPWSPSWNLANFLVSYDGFKGVGGLAIARNPTGIKIFNHSILDEFFTDLTSTFIFSHPNVVESSWFYPNCVKCLTDPFDCSVMLRNFILLLSCVRRNGMGDRWLKEISAAFFLPVAAFDPKIFAVADVQRLHESIRFPEPVRTVIQSSFSGGGLVVLFGHSILRRDTFCNHAEIPVLLKKIDDRVTEESALVHCARGLPRHCRLGTEHSSAQFKSAQISSNASLASRGKIFTIHSPLALYRRLLAKNTENYLISGSPTFQQQRTFLAGPGCWAQESLSTYWMNRFGAFNFGSNASGAAVRDGNVPVEVVLCLYILNNGRRCHSMENDNDNDDECEENEKAIYKLTQPLWNRILRFLVTSNN